MKKLTKNQQIKFYTEEIKEILKEHKAYLDSRCIDLINKSELNIGTFEYVDNLRNQLVFSFPKNKLPKTKILLTATKPKSEDIVNSNFNDYSYKYYRKNCVLTFTECYGVYYQEKNNKFNVGFSDFDVDFLDELEKGDKVVFGNSDPPLKYYFNLICITENLVKSKIVDDTILSNYHLDDFNPKNISNSLELIEKFNNELHKKDTIIIQGPPGTGKTFFISRLITLLSNNEKSILVATLANRSLIELAKKYFEINENIKGNVFKSNLTLEESKEVKELMSVPKDFYPAKGNIILTTFYKMTGLAVDNIKEPIYDYVILEEASQCFLGTIAAAKLLGKKLILVGDPLQLSPIIRQNNIQNISLNIELMEKSFTYYASTINCDKYRFTTTYRFSKNSCFQTNTFYDNSLFSKSEIQEDEKLLTELPSIYNRKGGSSIYYYDSTKLNNIYDFLFKEITFLLKKKSNLEIAILSSTKKGVKLLRDNLMFKFNDKQNQILINTVDGVQGLTVDFCFYFAFSTGNPSFSFQVNRFNVATSRARYCTIILLDEMFKVISPYKGLVADFLSKCHSNIIDELKFKKKRNREDNEKKPVEEIKDSSGKIKLKVVDFKDPKTFERPKKELIKDKENLYIIDTNVFVDYPNIISKISKEYPVILSAKVIDELDNLKSKLDNEGKRNVQKALKSINRSIDKRDLRMEVSDVSLLPVDFNRRSPDNKILSVALKYNSENPIILTSDNGLQIKAKGLNITTITLNEFLNQLKRKR